MTTTVYPGVGYFPGTIPTSTEGLNQDQLKQVINTRFKKVEELIDVYANERLNEALRCLGEELQKKDPADSAASLKEPQKVSFELRRRLIIDLRLLPAIAAKQVAELSFREPLAPQECERTEASQQLPQSQYHMHIVAGVVLALVISYLVIV